MMRTTAQCPCCHTQLDSRFHFEGGRRINAPSIDRFDPSLGYTVENISVICWRCNELKSDGTLAELRGIVRWMECRN